MSYIMVRLLPPDFSLSHLFYCDLICDSCVCVCGPRLGFMSQCVSTLCIHCDLVWSVWSWGVDFTVTEHFLSLCLQKYIMPPPSSALFSGLSCMGIALGHMIDKTAVRWRQMEPMLFF